jgi:sec-independent protein translocase protein TatA
MPFNIGPGELILVLVIVLIIFGPGKLPDIGSAIGKGVREFRKASTDIEESIRGETKPSTEGQASTANTAAASTPAPPQSAPPSVPPAEQGSSTPSAGSTSESH